VRVLAQNPRLGLPRQTLDTPPRSLKLPLNTRQGIFEHGPHQRRLGAYSAEAGLGTEELCWEHAGTGQMLMPGVSVGRHGQHRPCRHGLG
jgi:hypothetical protein